MNHKGRGAVAENDFTARIDGMRSTPGRIDSEIDIAELKSRIRSAVARREAEGRMSFAKASAQLFDLLSKDDALPELLLGELSTGDELSITSRELRLQPEFVRRPDDHYHVNDLLKYHDHQFVWNAYLALLKREPDEEGLRRYLEKLRSGHFNKIDILARLRYSPEGKRNNVTIDGLRRRGLVRRFYRLPVLGYFLELAVTVIRLPGLVSSQRQLEAHAMAQQERLADYINNTHRALCLELQRLNRNANQMHAELNETFSRAVQQLAKEMNHVASEQKLIARLQHEQLVAFFREQQGIAEAQPTTSENGRSFFPAFDLDELYASFHAQFRGDRQQIRKNLKEYLPLLKEAEIASDVLDLGCGSGEWLDLLREEGIRARGVESNRALIAEARSRNLEVVEADATLHLRTLPENSLRAITAFHFIEHLELKELIELLAEIRRTLKPKGLVILETPNPKNLVVGACNFYSDPTHRRPLFPESLEFILKQVGFARTRIQYLHPVEGSPFDNGDEGARALHSWFFSPRDYAVIAHKQEADICAESQS